MLRHIRSGFLVSSLAVALAVPAGLAQEAQSPGTGEMDGKIVEADGAAASGVLVMVAGRQLTTGQEGRFRLDSLQRAYYEVALVHPQHGQDTVQAPVAGGMTTGLLVTYDSSGEASADIEPGGVPTSRNPRRPRSEQGESRLLGRLMDRTTDRPIADATVRLEGRDRETTTSGQGRFSFDSLPAGTYTLRIRHVRYDDREAEVEIPGERTVDATVRIAPKAVEVEPVNVVVEADVRRRGLERSGYYDRKEWAQKAGYGHFLEAEDIENRGSQMSHILGSVPQLTASGQTNLGGQRVSGLVYFPRYMTGAFGNCLPAIYLDGHKVVGSSSAASHVDALGPRGINALVTPADVAGIEVYESAAATAGEFQGSDSRCGVVVIWTKRE